MNEKYRIWIICAAILFLFCFAGSASARTWSVDDSGGANFTRIQDAINNASIGDTILVHSGVYYENVVVDKSVTLRGIGHPVVDARWSGNAVTLTADGITLERFDITNAEGSWIGAGIKITSNNNNITGNNLRTNIQGIYLVNSSSNTITGNNVCNNGCGIYLNNSSSNTITDSTASNNWNGIYLVSYCNNNTIAGNKVCDNKDRGILAIDSNNNAITGNIVRNNECGINLASFNSTITGNIVSNNNDDGIILASSSNNTITGNTVNNNNDDGIRLVFSGNNTITGNTVCYNYDGIDLWHSSDNNTITGNNVCHNKNGGICLYFDSSNNSITDNTHVNDGLFVDSSYHNAVEENTVNGKPLVYLEDASDYKVEDAGQVILVNCSNITVENLDLSNTSVGIELWDTEDSTISNNKVGNNKWGIRLESSGNNTITGNTVCNNDNDGIRLESSSNNIITGTTVCDNGWASIRLSHSSNNFITGTTVCDNGWARIRLSHSSNNIIRGNNFSNNRGGIYLHDSSNNNTITGNTHVNDGLSVSSSYHNVVEENTVNGKSLVYLEDTADYKVEDAGQVILVNCSNITVENLDLTNTSVGVELWNTENSTIANNKICNNSRHGIDLYNSCNNTITGNTVCNNDDDGIDLESSSNNNTITGNNVSNNSRDGICLFSSSNNNTITGNNVSNNSRGGICLFSSSNNTITGNTFVNDGLFVDSSYHNTVEENTVNGKPLVYLEDASEYKVEDAGQVILVNCSNITVENLDLSNTTVGIVLWNTEDSTIANNKVYNNSRHGIYLYNSRNNIITGNTVCHNNDDGILLASSSNNTIIGNNVCNNNDHGINLLYMFSEDNLIYLNNFIDNTDNVYDDSLWTTIWNSKEEITYTYNGNRYISYLGNYWADYEEKYPDAEEIDSTGIWDTPYPINKHMYIKDFYPLVEPRERYLL